MTKYYTVREASEILRSSYRTVQRYLADGKLSYTKPAGKILISEQSLIDFIQINRKQRED